MTALTILLKIDLINLQFQTGQKEIELANPRRVRALLGTGKALLLPSSRAATWSNGCQPASTSPECYPTVYYCALPQGTENDLGT